MNQRILLLFLVITFIFTLNTRAGEDLFFSIEDPLNDDYGPGNYRYPANKSFQNVRGLFDITNFSIKDQSEQYIFRFTFQNLTDPWKSKYGFSLPLIQVYIDNAEGGCSELFREGANIRLQPTALWDLLLSISGWWVRAYQPEDRDKKDDFWQSAENPWDLTDAIIEVNNNTITLSINKEIIGPLENARLYVLVGGFDPFGPDYFRSVSQEETAWEFYTPAAKTPGYLPRVVDIILPEGQEQKSVLTTIDQQYPQVYPISINKTAYYLTAFNFYLFFGILILLIFIYIMYKNNQQRNTKE